MPARRFRFGLLLALAILAASALPAAAAVAKTIHVVEHATTDAVTNGSKNEKAGNILTFHNKVFDAANEHKVGSDSGYCVRIVVGKSWECNWTTFLKSGSITVEGPFSDTGNTVLAIVGGTGAYAEATGTMNLNYHNKKGTAFDFIFNLK
jgi:hypothetical protein